MPILHRPWSPGLCKTSFLCELPTLFFQKYGQFSFFNKNSSIFIKPSSMQARVAVYMYTFLAFFHIVVAKFFIYVFFFFCFPSLHHLPFIFRVSGSLPDTVTVENNKLMVKKVDETVNTTFICEVKNKHGISSNQITTFVIGESVQPTNLHADIQTCTVHAQNCTIQTTNAHMYAHKYKCVTCWDLV